MSDIWKKADNLEVEYKKVDGGILAFKALSGLVVVILVVLILGYGTVLNHNYTVESTPVTATPFALLGNGVPKPTSTASHTPTMTPSATFTATPTPTSTNTSTATSTPSNTPTDTPTSTPSHTPTMTPTSPATNTPTVTATATSQPFMAQYSQPTATTQQDANLEPDSGNGWNWQRVILFLAWACFAMAGIVGIVLYNNWQKSKIVTVTNGANRQRTPPPPLARPAVLRPNSNAVSRVNQPMNDAIQSIASIQAVQREPIQTQSTAVPSVITGEILGIGRGIVMRHDGREFVLPLDEENDLSDEQRAFIIAYYQSMPHRKRNLDNLCRFIYFKGGGGGVAYGRIQSVYNEWMIKRGKE